MIFRRAPAPVGEGTFYFYAPQKVEDSLRALGAGVPEPRAIFVADALPDEKDVRAIERQVRSTFSGRARRALAWGLWWALAAPAVALAIANLLPLAAGVFGWLPPLAAALATLGASSGGVVLAACVALGPLVWGWQRAGRELNRARVLGSLVRAAQRRLRSQPLRQEVHPALAAFAAESAAPLSRLRESLEALPDRGVDGAGEGATIARQISQLAARRGLPEISDAYHALYERLALAERRLGRAEGGGNVLEERRARSEASRTLRDARAIFAPFRSGARHSTSPLAPAVGALAGLTALILTVAITGIYLVPDGAALFLEGVGTRAGRLFSPQRVEAPPRPVSAIRGPASGWSAPFPFTGRRYVSLEPRVISIFSRLRPVGDDAYDIVEVRIGYRIVDVDRWALVDADEGGERRVVVGLSQRLDEFIGERRQEAAQRVAMENPTLANSPDQVFARADQAVIQQLDSYIRFFVTQAAPTMAQGAGIQISPQYQFQPRQAVDADVVEAILGQER